MDHQERQSKAAIRIRAAQATERIGDFNPVIPEREPHEYYVRPDVRPVPTPEAPLFEPELPLPSAETIAKAVAAVALSAAVIGGLAPKAESATEVRRDSQGVTVHTQTGDNLSQIADRFTKADTEAEIKANAAKIAKKNGIENPNKLPVNIDITVPLDLTPPPPVKPIQEQQSAQESHKMEDGETLTKWATIWNTTPDELAAYNGIPNANLVHAGKIIKRPPLKGVVEIVDDGETLWGYEQKYGQDDAEIAKENNVKPTKLRIGQKIIISHPTKNPSTTQTPIAAPSAPAVKPVAPVQKPAELPTVQSEPKVEVDGKVEVKQLSPQVEVKVAPAPPKLTAEQEKIIDSWKISDSRKTFVKEIVNTVFEVSADRGGVSDPILIAQIITESEYGESDLAAKYNNFTGQKVGIDSGWTGKSVNLETGEEVNGKDIVIRDNFRVYPTMKDGIIAYYDMVNSLPHFQDAAKHADNPELYIKGLQNEIDEQGNIVVAGKMVWATDKEYAENVMGMVKTMRLEEVAKPSEQKAPATTTIVQQAPPTTTAPTSTTTTAPPPTTTEAKAPEPTKEQLAEAADREAARALIDPNSIRNESNGIQTVEVKGMRVNVEIADNLSRLLVAAAGDDINLTKSDEGDFRSPETQHELRAKYCPDPENSEPDQCKIPVAKTGTSNHEKGLAIDFRDNGEPITSWNSRAAKWLKENAPTFGFNNKIKKEPWHWSREGN